MNEQKQASIRNGLRKELTWFDLFPSTKNRDIDERHVVKLMESMVERGFIPWERIQVYPSGEVSRGNHRFIAASRLLAQGYRIEPAFEVIPDDDYSRACMIPEGLLQDPLDRSGVLQIEARKGNPTAIKIVSIVNKYNTHARIIMRLLNLNVSGSIEKMLGTEITDAQEEMIVKILTEMDCFKVIPSLRKVEVRKRYNLVSSYTHLRSIEGFRYEVWVSRLSTNPTRFVHYANMADNLEMMIDLYNYRTHSSQTITMPAGIRKKLRAYVGGG